mmetsp:Transcript_59073/g.185377  ORF Transcript_59073/g.185377 Transcript_59073/m.185377 type:complete len:311 (+) Transcript_59073:955-1887(+)
MGFVNLPFAILLAVCTDGLQAPLEAGLDPLLRLVDVVPELLSALQAQCLQTHAELRLYAVLGLPQLRCEVLLALQPQGLQADPGLRVQALLEFRAQTSEARLQLGVKLPCLQARLDDRLNAGVHFDRGPLHAGLQLSLGTRGAGHLRTEGLESSVEPRLELRPRGGGGGQLALEGLHPADLLLQALQCRSDGLLPFIQPAQLRNGALHLREAGHCALVLPREASGELLEPLARRAREVLDVPRELLHAVVGAAPQLLQALADLLECRQSLLTGEGTGLVLDLRVLEQSHLLLARSDGRLEALHFTGEALH